MQTCFDDTKGSLAVNHCASEATRADLEGTALRCNYYLALGAAGALLNFLQQVWEPSCALAVPMCTLMHCTFMTTLLRHDTEFEGERLWVGAGTAHNNHWRHLGCIIREPVLIHAHRHCHCSGTRIDEADQNRLRRKQGHQPLLVAQPHQDTVWGSNAKGMLYPLLISTMH